jgi:hypothetical protein
MPRSGRRHCLVLYTYMLDRWWKSTLRIGILLLALAIALWFLPIQLPQYHFLWVSDLTLGLIAGAGAYAIILSVLLIFLRKSAYVQPFPAYLLLITPFLRLNISYRRILQASSVEMQHLFSFGRNKGLRKRLLRPLASQTAILLEMRGWPLPRWFLSLFLSPFFFPDRTPRMALLVPNWMDFSVDMENFRSTWLESLRQTGNSPQSDILASIKKAKK